MGKQSSGGACSTTNDLQDRLLPQWRDVSQGHDRTRRVGLDRETQAQGAERCDMNDEEILLLTQELISHWCARFMEGKTNAKYLAGKEIAFLCRKYGGLRR